MQELHGAQLESFLEGMVGSRRDDSYLQPLRLDEVSLNKCHPALDTPHVAQATNGIRLRFQTDSRYLELHLTLITSERTAFALEAGATAPPTIDLLFDEKIVDRRRLKHGPERQIIRFELSSFTANKVCEVWLPHNVGVRIHSLKSDSDIQPLNDSRPRWIFHGSSITHDALAPGPSDTWPARIARLKSWHLTQLGFRGECHLDYGVAQSIASTRADGIILELGINIHNFQSFRERTLGSALLGFLDNLRNGHPTTPIVVVSPVFGAERENEKSSLTFEGERIFGDLDLPLIRDALYSAVSKRKLSGDNSIFYIDGLELLGPDDSSLFPDGLHPNHVGTEFITKRLSKRLGDLNL